MQRVVGGVRSQQPSPALGDQHGATYAQLERQVSSWSVGRVLAASVWLLVVGLLAAIGAVVATRNMREKRESGSSSTDSFGQLRGLGPDTQVRKDDCKLMAEDVMYWTTAQLEDIHNVSNASDCLKACQLRFFCRAWTWSKNAFVAEDVEVESFAAEGPGSGGGGGGRGGGGGEGDAGVCFLRGLEEDEVPRMLKKSGVVSGIPCHMIWGPEGLTKEEDEGGDKAAVRATTTTTTKRKSTSTTAAPTTTTRATTSTTTKATVTTTATTTAAMKQRDFRADDWRPTCGVLDNRTDYKTVLDRGVVRDIGTADYCFHVCEHRSDCDAFTWGKARAVDGLSDHCFLKALGEGEQEVTKEENSKVVSGLACKHLRSSGGSVAKKDRASLFCWALMLPGSYEEELLAMQHRHSMNIFSCDASSVYSNTSINIKDAFDTRVVPVKLRVPMGGEFMTALNTDVFIAIWKQVVADGVYLKHDWTIKTDPDTVFFASRLQKILAHHPPAREGVYLNNCWRGMHGPIEVFSLEAVTVWGNGFQRCQEEFTKLCSGPCQWGEDMFIDQCLWRVLGVKRDDAFELLVEDHCDPPEDDSWRFCQDANSVAYHPFKTLDGYKECYSNSARQETHASG